MGDLDLLKYQVVGDVSSMCADLSEIRHRNNDLFMMLTDAYLLGRIQGRRDERARRKQAGA